MIAALYCPQCGQSTDVMLEVSKLIGGPDQIHVRYFLDHSCQLTEGELVRLTVAARMAVAAMPITRTIDSMERQAYR